MFSGRKITRMTVTLGHVQYL